MSLKDVLLFIIVCGVGGVCILLGSVLGSGLDIIYPGENRGKGSSEQLRALSTSGYCRKRRDRYGSVAQGFGRHRP